MSMKKMIFFAVFSFVIGSLQAQQVGATVNEGDVFTISDPSGPEFNHLHFPRKNFIMKRGGVPDMKKVKGLQVVVTAVDSNNGKTRVTLERRDGGKFFRHYRTVDASLDQALASGELTR